MAPGEYLTARQRRFAQLYVSDPERNASRAARLAGFTFRPGADRVQGCHLLHNPRVREYVDSLTKAADAQAHAATTAAVREILEYHTRILREARPDRFFRLATDGQGGGPASLVPDYDAIRKASPGVVRIQHTEGSGLAVQVADPTPSANTLLAYHARTTSDLNPSARQPAPPSSPSSSRRPMPRLLSMR